MHIGSYRHAEEHGDFGGGSGGERGPIGARVEDAILEHLAEAAGGRPAPDQRRRRQQSAPSEAREKAGDGNVRNVVIDHRDHAIAINAEKGGIDKVCALLAALERDLVDASRTHLLQAPRCRRPGPLVGVRKLGTYLSDLGGEALAAEDDDGA